jgi:hypothetical protein
MKTKIYAPAGMTGLAVEPWNTGEVYAVAANWAQAASPVMVYGRNGWECDGHGRQVADFRHDPKEALESEIRKAMVAWHEIDEDHSDEESELEKILDDAEELDAEDDDAE